MRKRKSGLGASERGRTRREEERERDGSEGRGEKNWQYRVLEFAGNGID